MPNGGSEHCGNCRHNRVVGGEKASCTVRNVEIPAAASTICANHYRDLKKPLGPIFASIDAHDRIPYHDDARPRPKEVSRCRLCAAGSRGNFGVELAHPTLGKLYFCGVAHYTRWWKQEHPEVALVWDCDAPPPTHEQVSAREVAAMLALARAYLGIGDREGAREVLEETAKTAAGSERDEVATLLELLR